MMPIIKKIGLLIYHWRLGIVSILLLAGLGLTLLEIAATINVDPSQERLSEGQANQQAARIELDEKIVGKIRERQLGLTPLTPPKDPFNY